MASVTGRVNEPLNNLLNYSKRWFVPIESDQHVTSPSEITSSVGRAAAILFFFVINQRFGNCERGNKNNTAGTLQRRASTIFFKRSGNQEVR
jgi:hypothetical protein